MLYTAPLLSSSSAKIIEGEYIIVFKREASTDEGERERECVCVRERERERERENTIVLVHNIINVPTHFLAAKRTLSLYDYCK